MIRTYMLGLLGVAAVAAALVAPVIAAPKGIQWQEDLAKGLTQARKERKPALIDFYADWCGWCKRLDADTYSDPRVIALSKRFVMIKVNTEGERRTMIKYGVRGLPTIVITDSQGRETNRVSGYRPATSFLDEMQIGLRQARASR